MHTNDCLASFETICDGCAGFIATWFWIVFYDEQEMFVP